MKPTRSYVYDASDGVKYGEVESSKLFAGVLTLAVNPKLGVLMPRRVERLSRGTNQSFRDILNRRLSVREVCEKFPPFSVAQDRLIHWESSIVHFKEVTERLSAWVRENQHKSTRCSSRGANSVVVRAQDEFRRLSNDLYNANTFVGRYSKLTKDYQGKIRDLEASNRQLKSPVVVRHRESQRQSRWRRSLRA